MKNIFFSLVLLSFFGLSQRANAQTIRYVKSQSAGSGNGSSWANASSNIQNMINASAIGDQVWICGGSYPLSATLTMKEGVNVYGGFLGIENSVSGRYRSDLDGNGIIEGWEFTNATVLNGQNTRQVLNQASNFAILTVWDGVTITNGRNTASLAKGGGAFIQANGKLANCIINGNTAYYYNIDYYYSTYGGGVYNNGGSITDCKISGNTTWSEAASWGGGIYNIGGGTVTNCVVSGNTATSSRSAGWGGGIYNGNGAIINCVVRGNQTTNSRGLGGGIYCDNTTTCIVNDCIIENNQIAGAGNIRQGGGIFQGNINRCIIRGNSAMCGGGLYGSIARNCLIANNNATDTGGGVYATTNTSFINCTFVNNTANVHSGGIYATTSVTATNCIFWGNTATQIAGGIQVIYSGVQGGFVGLGNINLAAKNDTVGGVKFIDPIRGNYQLKAVSPCINVGITAAVSPLDTIDLAGNIRIYGNIVDMGAYECQDTCAKDTTFYTVVQCGNTPYADNNFTNLTQEGNYYNTLQNIHGCDSIVCLTLIIDTVTIINYAENICSGMSYTDNYFTNLTQSGTYYDTVFSILGCDSIITALHLTVNPLPFKPLITRSGNVLTSTVANSYQWYFNSQSISGATNQTYANAQEGVYFVEVANEYGCTSKSDEITVFSIIKTYTISGNVTHEGNLLSGVAIIYSGGDSVITNILGEYSITVDSNASLTLMPRLLGYSFTPSYIKCDNVTSNLSNQNFTATSVGIVETRRATSLQVYPNPTNCKLTISNYDLQITEIEIYDVYGRKVFTSPNPSEGGELPSFGGAGGGVIDISHLANGMYFLKAGKQTVKFVKE